MSDQHEPGDFLFPVDQQYEDGQPIGSTSADLGRAIECWFYAQNRLGVTVGEAALAWNLTPAKIEEAVTQYGSSFFWIEKRPVPLEQRAFDCDGL